MKHALITIGSARAFTAGVAAQTPAVTGTTWNGHDGDGRWSIRRVSRRGRSATTADAAGVLLRLDLKNATPCVRGLHIHEVGRCDAPSFESAGRHFSPDRRAHGFLNTRGPHPGDLPNIFMPVSTELSLEYLMPDVTLDPGPRSLLDANGSALVIHASKDA
jgi:Cu-Zn family superoxide dismutase